MVSLLKRIYSYFSFFKKTDHAALARAEREASAQPWASFEITDFEEGGRVAVSFNWNQAFYDHIKALGFEAETQEDSVQLFFFTSMMRPTSMASDPNDDAVQSAEHPQLSGIKNEVRV
jgi:hypothetical protein